MARVQTEMSLSGVAQVIDGFKRAGSAARQYAAAAIGAGNDADKGGGKIRQAGRYVTQHADELGHAGSSMQKTGLILGATVMGVVKAAADWESAWAGVTKTVNGTPEQMAALESQLRGLTQILPASHEEIAGVAEAAGQLGIQRQNVAGFTQTMIEMGESTNLSADEAATSIAQMMNIMGTSQDNASRMGATIVALGNAGASTEQDITQMGLRIAAAGKQVGMSESDVLGFANALASTGVEAEAGGTAISQTFKQVDSAVREGGASLDTIARASGMTSAQFKQAWGQDAAGAMSSFISGLGGAQKAGQDVNKTLSDLGMTGMRQSDSILRLASATKAAGAQQDLLADSLRMGASAWDQNIALTNEAAKRHATLASQATIAWNQVKDSAITAGQYILPSVAQLVQTLAGLAQAFGSLPGPVQKFGLSFMTISAGTLIATGSIMKFLSFLGSVKKTLDGFGVSLKTAMGGFGIVGAAIGVASIALGAWVTKQQEAKQRVEDYTSALQGQTKAINEATVAVAAKNLQDAGAFDYGKKLGLSSATVTQAALGQKDALGQVSAAIARANAEYQKYGLSQDAAASKNKGAEVEAIKRSKNAQDQLAAAKQLQAAIGQQNDAFGTAAAKQKELQDAVAAAGPSEEQSAKQKQDIADKAQAAAQAMDDLINSTQQYGNMLLQMSGNAIGVESAIDAATEAYKKNGKNLDIDTEAGRNNMQALNGIAQASMAQVKTMAEAGASTVEMTKATKKARDSFISTAEQMGMTASEAQKLADAYFAIPKTTDMTINSNIKGATPEQIEQLQKDVDKLPAEKASKIITTANTKGYDAAKRQLDEMNGLIQKSNHDVEVHIKGVTDKKQVDDFMVQLNKLPKDQQTKVAATADTKGLDAAVAQMGQFLAMDGKNVSIPTQAPGAGDVINQFRGVKGSWDVINGKAVFIPTSAPGATGTAGQIDGVYGAWKNVNGKRVFVPSAAPGAGPAKTQIQQLNQIASTTNGKHVEVTAHASTSDAESSLAYVARDRSMTIRANVITVGGGKAAQRGMANANGNLYEAHQAQIARAGEWRIWAEPETGGEAYIPLAQSKRPRSRRIAAETVARLGGAVAWNAAGSITSGKLGPTSSQINVQLNLPTGSFADLAEAINAQTVAQRNATRAGNAWRKASAKNRKATGEAYNKAKDDLKSATDAAKSAIESFASAAQSAGAKLSDQFRAGGSASDMLSAMTEGASQLATFQKQLNTLRHMGSRGLSQENIDTLMGMGIGQGSAVAAEIIKGGMGTVNALNKASDTLKKISDQLGKTSLAKFGVGGTVTRPTYALVGESGVESIIPHDGSARARELWLNAGREIGMLGDGSAYQGTQGQTITVAPPEVHQTVLVDLGDLGGRVEARVLKVQTRTARNVARRTR